MLIGRKHEPLDKQIKISLPETIPKPSTLDKSSMKPGAAQLFYKKGLI